MACTYASDGYWASLLRKSLSKLMILESLSKGPIHGYGLIRRMSLMSDRFFMPAQGAVYPALRDFERAGCVRHEIEALGRRRRKVYLLTPEGRKALRAGLAAWERGLACMQKAIEHS